MNQAPERASISVVIPTKNGGDWFRDLLAALRGQAGPRRIEIIVVDSGSRDGTLDTARKFDAEIVQIPPAAFSHSGARNLGAARASGDYLLFTVQDALPPSPAWLSGMLRPFACDGVVAVSCAEAPRPDADLFYRAISRHHNRFLDIEAGDRILARPPDGDPAAWRKNAQLSDVACLIRRRVFDRYRYRGDYAEDLDLGLRLIADGHQLALLGSTPIIHSHNRAPYYYLQRGYVDHSALLRLFPNHPTTFVSAGDLLADVVESEYRMNALDDRVSRLALPCDPSKVQETVRRGLQPSASAVFERRRNGHHLDQRSRHFIDELARRDGGRDSTPSHSVVMQATQGFVEVIFDFINARIALIGPDVLEDLRSALYKGWALQCGVLLASSYCGGDESDKARLHHIDHELRSGV